MMSGPVKAPLRGLKDVSNKVYFFTGDQHWRYDLKKDYGEVNYPRPIRDAWSLPADFHQSIDACLPGQGIYSDMTFFFRDGWFASYDWTKRPPRSVSHEPLTQWCKGSPFPFPNGFDAALAGDGKYAGKAYFFRGAKYSRYDWNEDKFDLVDQDVRRWGLGERFQTGVDACLTVKESGSKSSAYFFKGAEYARYDWPDDKAAPGYPLPIAAGWPTGCAVWASHSQVPENVCVDPRLDSAKNRFAAFPFGSLRGQAGWQAMVQFKTIKELADRLENLAIPPWYGDDNAGKEPDDKKAGRVPAGRITRLGLSAHGQSGSFEANGENPYRIEAVGDPPPKTGITEMKLLMNKELSADFKRIAQVLAPGASVILLGCNAAQGTTGGQLLMTLSQIMAGHPVTGFTSIAYVSTEQKRNDGCYEAGIRDTNAFRHSEADRTSYKYWSNLVEWPWACETSPRAKTALNGEIIRRPLEDLAY
jgi:hypothetical protein